MRLHLPSTVADAVDGQLRQPFDAPREVRQRVADVPEAQDGAKAIVEAFAAALAKVPGASPPAWQRIVASGTTEAPGATRGGRDA